MRLRVLARRPRSQDHQWRVHIGELERQREAVQAHAVGRAGVLVHRLAAGRQGPFGAHYHPRPLFEPLSESTHQPLLETVQEARHVHRFAEPLPQLPVDDFAQVQHLATTGLQLHTHQVVHGKSGPQTPPKTNRAMRRRSRAHRQWAILGKRPHTRLRATSARPRWGPVAVPFGCVVRPFTTQEVGALPPKKHTGEGVLNDLPWQRMP